MKNQVTYSSPVGLLQISESNDKITEVKFVENKTPKANGKSKLLDECIKQLGEYFAGKRQVFDLPLDMQGTDFQKKVWTALLDIPYGTTVSYKRIAEFVGNPKGARAVGLANNKNNIPIIIPCHRVIGASGKLIGYSDGVDKKAFLLKLEMDKSDNVIWK